MLLNTVVKILGHFFIHPAKNLFFMINLSQKIINLHKIKTPMSGDFEKRFLF